MSPRKRRAVTLAAACLAAALSLAPAASASTLDASFDTLPPEVARNTPITTTLRVTNTSGADVADLALGIHPAQMLDDESEPPVSIQAVDCQGGTRVTPDPVAGTPACRWATTPQGTGHAMSVTFLPADGAYVFVNGYLQEGLAGPIEYQDGVDTQVARPQADLNLQVQAPAQLAVGQTAELKTTLNMVSGDSADGVHQVPRFVLDSFGTREVDVIGVAATAGTCLTEPVKDYDPVGGVQVVVPDMVTISCHGGALAPGGSITVTVTVRAKAPGVVDASPFFAVTNMRDSTPLQHWWEYPEFRIGVFQAPAPPAFVDPTPLDQAELLAPAGGVLKVSKKGAATLKVACHVAGGCPQATLFYAGGKGKSKIAGQLKLRALKANQTAAVTLKLTKKQLKALQKTKKKGVQIKITGAELVITTTLVAAK